MPDHRDAADPLADVRTRFMLPDDVIYLDGNSLGPPARSAAERLHHVVAEQWGDGLIRSWNDADWVGLPARCAQLLAPWLGARDARSVTVTDSITVNLGKLV
ncbi:MAG: kynureninase, partial [Glaciecola sp.]